METKSFTNIDCNGEVVEEDIKNGYYCGEEPVPEEEEKSTTIDEEEDYRYVSDDEKNLSLTDALVPFINEVKRRLDSKDASLWFVFIAFLIYHLVIFYLFLFLVLLLIIGKKV
jgi:flagellar biosynthesis/type III secretory pathway M-ring protein FliF/YscJ